MFKLVFLIIDMVVIFSVEAGINQLMRKERSEGDGLS